MRRRWRIRSSLRTLRDDPDLRLYRGLLGARRALRAAPHGQRRRRIRWHFYATPVLLFLALLGATGFVLRAVFFLVLWSIARLVPRAFRLAARRVRTRLSEVSEALETGAATSVALAPVAIASHERRERHLTPIAQRLQAETRALPASTHPTLLSLVEHVALVEKQLEGAPDGGIERAQLAHLCDHDLRELIASFRRVPPSLSMLATDHGPSPVEQLGSGLAMIDAELVRLHQRLAEQDLKSLATHSRYLALKYGDAIDVSRARE